MPKITISKKEVEVKQEMRLNNGDLLIYKDKIAMVTTYDGRAEYCAFMDLSTGGRVCTEPCSRKTTRKRVGAHLRYWAANHSGATISYNKIEHYKKDTYEIDLQIMVTADSICSDACYSGDIKEGVPVEVESKEHECPNCGYKQSSKKEKEEDF